MAGELRIQAGLVAGDEAVAMLNAESENGIKFKIETQFAIRPSEFHQIARAQ